MPWRQPTKVIKFICYYESSFLTSSIRVFSRSEKFGFLFILFFSFCFILIYLFGLIFLANFEIFQTWITITITTVQFFLTYTVYCNIWYIYNREYDTISVFFFILTLDILSEFLMFFQLLLTIFHSILCIWFFMYVLWFVKLNI